MISILFISCEEPPENDVKPDGEEDVENDSTVTIEAYLSSESKYSQFLELLKSDGEISSVLNDQNKDITLFAVSDETINSAVTELGIDSLNQLYLQTLQEIIRYHINTTASLQKEDFNEDGIISTLQAENIKFDGNINISSGGLDDEIEFIGDEIILENGVIHEIEFLMIPPSIFEEMTPSLNTIHFPVEFCTKYSQFKEILNKAEEFESESIIGILQNKELNLTLFLPKNDSFNSSEFEQFDTGQKYFLISNHILECRLTASQLEGTFTTKSGIGVIIDSEGNIDSPVEEDSYEIIISQYNAYTDYNNGIIHEIEGIITNPGIRFSSENIYNTISNDGEFSDLKSLINHYPDLLNILQSDQSLTVFAPTNSAFEKLRAALGIEDLTSINPAVLNNVLAYHVSTENSYRRFQFNEDFELGTAQGENIIFNINGNPATGGSNIDVQFADLATQASNGIIHPIESVLIPPSVFQLISSILGTVAQPILLSADFTILAAAIAKADAFAEGAGQTTLSDILSDYNLNLTVFAPVNQVFEGAGISLDTFTGQQWYAIIAEHIVSGDLSTQDISTALSQGDNTLTTLSGANVQITATDFQGAPTIAIGDAPVVAADMEFQNGHVHAIAGIVSSVNSYSTVLLGGQNNTDPGFYNALNNVRYTYSPAAENSNFVDLAFYFTNADQATLASIDSEVLHIVYDLIGLPIEATFTIRNSSRFRVTSLAPDQFNGIFLNSQLEDLATSENNTNSSATNLQEGSIVAFQLDASRGGYVGLIKVVEISGDDSSSRTITIEVKIQVAGN
jgi:uncharacterized surface protein with fasciclin (FAS1) repeats